MKILYGLVIAALLVVCSQSSYTPVTPCAEGNLPSDVRIKGCTKAPCKLYRGDNATAEWDFVVDKPTSVLKPRVKATVLGITVDYPFPQDNACATLKDSKCPLHAGEAVTYLLSMPILKAYPKIPLVIEFGFLGDDQAAVVCYRVSCKVVDK